MDKSRSNPMEHAKFESVWSITEIKKRKMCTPGEKYVVFSFQGKVSSFVLLQKNQASMRSLKQCRIEPFSVSVIKCRKETKKQGRQAGRQEAADLFLKLHESTSGAEKKQTLGRKATFEMFFLVLVEKRTLLCKNTSHNFIAACSKEFTTNSHHDQKDVFTPQNLRL